MARSEPRRVRSYSAEFKVRAVAMSRQPRVLVRDVAEPICFSLGGDVDETRLG